MSQFVTDRSYDYFDLGDESDQESAESSEDEIDIILHGTPEQRRRLCHSHAKEQHQKAGHQPRQSNSKSLQLTDKQQSSSEDEFEKEMNAELDKTVSMLEKSRGSKEAQGSSAHSSTASAPNTATQNSSSVEKSKALYYNDIYFDSDDEDNYEGEGEARVQRHHAKLTNDDLLYDPNMDDEDQRWVDRQRQVGADKQASGAKKAEGKKRSAPKSDAVLDCPACMTTLCLDCQRHDIYPNQFRAMFVMNCKVNHSEWLSVPEQADKKKFKKSKKSRGRSEESGDCGSHEQDSGSSSRDQFHPVMCAECDTVVGVVDVEEVFHFFNVLVSLA